MFGSICLILGKRFAALLDAKMESIAFPNAERRIKLW